MRIKKSKILSTMSFIFALIVIPVGGSIFSFVLAIFAGTYLEFVEPIDSKFVEVVFTSLIGIIWFYVFWFIIIFRGPAFFFRLSRQFKQLTATELISVDKRKPILYLRPFNDDRHVRKSKKGCHMTLFTEEDEMVTVLQSIGPVISVGKPKSKLPALGAAQTYINDVEWKEQVENLIIQSNLVFIRIGATKGILWELDQTINKLSPDQIVLIVPSFEYINYSAVMDLFRIKFSLKLPDIDENDLEIKDSNIPLSTYGFITFDSNWCGHFSKLYGTIKCKTMKEGLIHFMTRSDMVIIDLYVNALKPVFIKQKVDVNIPNSNYYFFYFIFWMLTIFVCAFVVFVLPLILMD